MDRIPKSVRSRVMASVRGRGTRLEGRVLELLRAEGVQGYRRWARELPGKPDFVFRAKKVAIFVDSCFWHGCKWHLRMPSSNIEYWSNKIRRNRLRDIEVYRALSERGWTVVRIWEHELKCSSRVARKIQKALLRAA